MAVAPRGRRGMRIEIVWLAPCAMFPSLKSSGGEDWHGPIRWAGCARADLHACGHGTDGKAAHLKRGGDKRARARGGDPIDPGPRTSLPRGRDAERLVVRDSRATGGGDHGNRAGEEQGLEGRPEGRLEACERDPYGRHWHPGLQGSETSNRPSKRGHGVPDGNPGRRAREESPEDGISLTRDSRGERRLRGAVTDEVVEAAAGRASGTRGMAGTRAGHACAFAGESRGRTAEGSEDAPIQPHVEYGPGSRTC